jgi:hypothetical protein
MIADEGTERFFFARCHAKVKRNLIQAEEGRLRPKNGLRRRDFGSKPRVSPDATLNRADGSVKPRCQHAKAALSMVIGLSNDFSRFHGQMRPWRTAYPLALALAFLIQARTRSRMQSRSNSAFCGSSQNVDDAECAIMQSHSAEAALWPAYE